MSNPLIELLRDNPSITGEHILELSIKVVGELIETDGGVEIALGGPKGNIAIFGIAASSLDDAQTIALLRVLRERAEEFIGFTKENSGKPITKYDNPTVQ
jgi:hypothetical protein